MNNYEYGEGLKTWQWLVTAAVIVVLIIMSIFVFGEKPKTDDVQTSSSKSYNSPLEDKLRRCFADGGYVRTELSAFKSMSDVDTLVCYIQQSRTL